ncbi:hypothetical protein ACHAPT_010786 [Fusarium lateritium]
MIATISFASWAQDLRPPFGWPGTAGIFSQEQQLDCFSLIIAILSSAPVRRYVAVKVFGAKTGKDQQRLDHLLQRLSSPGNSHTEIGLGSVTVQGPNGTHYCQVLAPLGSSLSDVLQEAVERRAEFNNSEGSGSAKPIWSARLAKQACWQVLRGLDYLHSHEIAHRDVRPGNVLIALQSDLSFLGENDIQMAVWPSVQQTSEQGQVGEDDEDDADDEDDRNDQDTSDSSSDGYSDEERRNKDEEWEKQLMERRRIIDERWKSFGTGDRLATPHSSEWNAANLVNSRQTIELLVRADGEPLKPDEIQYTVQGIPLDDGFDISKAIQEDKEFRLVLGDLGLLCWEIVMLQPLVWPQFLRDDPERIYQKNRQVYDLAQRLGPVPPEIRAKWRDADSFVDAHGNALDMQEQDEMTYEPEDFEYGEFGIKLNSGNPRICQMGRWGFLCAWFRRCYNGNLSHGCQRARPSKTSGSRAFNDYIPELHSK